MPWRTMERKKFDTVDEYIASYPPEVRVILEKIRGIVRKAAQGAEEKISYGMPTFKMRRNLVHFAAFKGHIGLYPAPSATRVFAKELEPYESGKGSIRFPLDNAIPYDLIKRIVEFRVKEESEK